MLPNAQNLKVKSAKTSSRREFFCACLTGITCVVAQRSLLGIFSQNTSQEPTIDVAISGLNPGEEIRTFWLNKPLIIRRRTPNEIWLAQNTNIATLADPQHDSQRVKIGKEEWLVLIGICTQSGLALEEVMNNQPTSRYLYESKESKYDTSGRAICGLARLNLAVPPYRFLGENFVRIG